MSEKTDCILKKEENKQKIYKINKDFNNEEILTENVEEHLKSCQILERVKIIEWENWQ